MAVSVIRPLPSDLVAQIRSSTIITSLNDCVIDLVKNSLDANARQIYVCVDYGHGDCSVEDDGIGIPPAEFGAEGGLGKPNHTSKYSSQNETYGTRGNFLASLAALSIVSIYSRHYLHHSHSTITLHRSEVITRRSPEVSQYRVPSENGTRVTVRDLFGSMPVRVKQRAKTTINSNFCKEWEDLKKALLELSLSWPDELLLSVKDASTRLKYTLRHSSSLGYSKGPFEISGLPRIQKILEQASYISASERSSWIPVSASSPTVTVSGAVSLIPSASKRVQFISTGIQPLGNLGGHSHLYELINRLFSNSYFGVDAELDNERLESQQQDATSSHDEYEKKAVTRGELKASRKGVDRWPMFVFNLRINEQLPKSVGIDAEHTLEELSRLDHFAEVIEATILEFLKRNHFSPRSDTYTRNRQTRSKIPLSPVLFNNQMCVAIPQKSNTIVGERVTSASACKPRSAAKRSSSHGQITRSSESEGNMPSFRGTASPSPFQNWSRVKVGKSTYSFPKEDKKYVVGGDLQKSKQIADKAGKIIRKPFADVDDTSTANSTLRGTNVQTVEATSDPEPIHGDNMIRWTNPSTKKLVYVNSRTGLTGTSKEGRFRLTLNQPGSFMSEQGGSSLEGNSKWINDLLAKWDNPIYCSTESPIPQLFPNGLDFDAARQSKGQSKHGFHLDKARASEGLFVPISLQLSKDSLRHPEVIAQIDKKFILVKIAGTPGTQHGRLSNDLLVIIDQHAADERCRAEKLLSELCGARYTDKPAGTASNSCSVSTRLEPNVSFEISTIESDLFYGLTEYFKKWGIFYEIRRNDRAEQHKIVVRSLPPVIAERCAAEPRLLIDLLRSEIWKRQTNQPDSISARGSDDAKDGPSAWLNRIQDCPQGILNLLISRSCRSAIMFNDELTKEHCRALIVRLAECAFPFQCAHGRPSMIPLADLEMLREPELENQRVGNEKRGNYGTAFKAWKASMNGSSHNV